jgi:hypothetical protein
VADAREVRLIYVRSLKGDGTAESPCREVRELFTRRGELVARFDPHSETESIVTNALGLALDDD